MIIFEGAVNLFEASMILYFLLRGLDCKWTGWKKWVSFSLSVIILFTLITFENKYRIFEGFDSIPLILFLLLYSFFCLQEHIFTKALMVFVVMSMVHSTNTVVVAVYSFISHVPVQELASEYTIHRVFAIILTKIVFFILSMSSFYVFRKESLDHKQQVLTILNFAVIAFSGGAALKIASKNDLTTDGEIMLFTFMLGMWIVGIISYFLSIRIFYDDKSLLKKTARAQMDFYKDEEMKELQRHYREILSLRHDMKNHLGCILQMLKTDQISEAIHYLEEVSNPVRRDPSILINTNNAEVDALLNIKFRQLAQQNSDVKCMIAGDISAFDPIDMCRIFGNLLDNIIDANEQLPVEQRRAELIVTNDRNYLHIIVKNHIQYSVLMDNPELITVKKDKSVHGFGHQIIKDCVERLQGILYYYEEDDMFCCSILLPTMDRNAAIQMNNTSNSQICAS